MIEGGRGINDRHRWLVREAVKDDAAAMLSFARTVFSEPGPYLPVTAEEFTLSVDDEEAVIERHRTMDNAVFLLAFDQASHATNHLVGMLNANGSSRKALRHAVEFGMSVARPYRGQGVGSALLEALLAWGRATQLVSRIELRVYEENLPARHLYEKFGFQVDGRRRRAVFQDGRYHDDLIMSLLL